MTFGGLREYYKTAIEAGLSKDEAMSLLKERGNYTLIEKIVFQRPENLIISIKEAKKNLGEITKDDVESELRHQKNRYSVEVSQFSLLSSF
jgi:hypothetical protein